MAVPVLCKSCKENLTVKYELQCLGFEAITAVVMKGLIFWAITPCGLLKVVTCYTLVFCWSDFRP
jgi:hypothetical protein